MSELTDLIDKYLIDELDRRLAHELKCHECMEWNNIGHKEVCSRYTAPNLVGIEPWRGLPAVIPITDRAEIRMSCEQEKDK